MGFVDTSFESGRDISRYINIHVFNSLGFASTGGGGLFRWGIESLGPNSEIRCVFPE